MLEVSWKETQRTSDDDFDLLKISASERAFLFNEDFAAHGNTISCRLWTRSTAFASFEKAMECMAVSFHGTCHDTARV